LGRNSVNRILQQDFYLYARGRCPGARCTHHVWLTGTATKAQGLSLPAYE
jgi:hypothetical protein